MQLLTTIVSLVAAATCVSARGRPPLAKRDVGGILICNGANATGACHYEVYSLTDCHNMPDGFSGNTKTFAPDGDSFFCWPTVYVMTLPSSFYNASVPPRILANTEYRGQCEETCTSPTGCTFGAVDFYSPVKWDLSTIQWDQLIESFNCHLNETAA
ncbi:hypothetical protein GGR54DRAFT_635387 [Hypoxylon sp. NC1633]|nr:hypothetical protein GGR54DRAFT_635387 [Hypoxylon sp. NC1633]